MSDADDATEIVVVPEIFHPASAYPLKLLDVRSGDENLRPPWYGENIRLRRKAVMDKIIISLALLIGGVVLMIFGINATNSFGSEVSRFFTGSPTDKAIWMFIGGTVAAVIGLVSTLRSWKQT